MQQQWARPQVEPQSRYGNDDADTTDWFDRWGRKFAGGLAVLVAALLLAGAGIWLYSENKLDTTLQVLAKAPIPARQAKLVSAPLPLEASTVTATAPAPEQALPTPAGTVLGAEETSKRAAKKAANTRAKDHDASPTRANTLSETLRLCRAEGYHAARCVQLACKATRYGLACKGS